MSIESREYFAAMGDKLRKPPVEARGLCCSCRFWQACTTQVANDCVAMQCGASRNCGYGLMGQDGKAIITPAEFGCILYKPQVL